MQVEIKRSDIKIRFPGEEIIGATITDGTETLILKVVEIDERTYGRLYASNGRTWGHHSVAAINLLILHARAAVTVRELLEDLGPCDEALDRKAKAKT